jgi:TPP-dependent pyruvate/acetoin dehydrogenase alpha subunit
LLGGEIIIKYSVESVKIVDEFPIERYRELGLDDSDLLRMFEVMLRIRRFEEAVERLFIVEGKLIGPCHLYLGQEAVATG